jgi:hypothetical protein
VSIALNARLIALEAKLAEFAYQIALLQKRVTELENRPKPGRPPKNG